MIQVDAFLKAEGEDDALTGKDAEAAKGSS